MVLGATYKDVLQLHYSRIVLVLHLLEGLRALALLLMLLDVLLMSAVQVLIAADEVLYACQQPSSHRRQPTAPTYLKEHILHHVVHLEVLVSAPEGLEVLVCRFVRAGCGAAVWGHGGASRGWRHRERVSRTGGRWEVEVAGLEVVEYMLEEVVIIAQRSRDGSEGRVASGGPARWWWLLMRVREGLFLARARK